jgi:hypothetical protein
MCNGNDPWTLLYRGGGNIVKAFGQTTDRVEGIGLSQDHFMMLKSFNNDRLLRLAIDTLQARSPSDVPYDEACRALKLTLRENPENRALSFAEVVDVFNLNHATTPMST